MIGWIWSAVNQNYSNDISINLTGTVGALKSFKVSARKPQSGLADSPLTSLLAPFTESVH